ncbi:MAG: glycosyltransferase [Bacteroidales bacterium]|nr:glycosyltransferase [Bacteroidales bacterium]
MTPFFLTSAISIITIYGILMCSIWWGWQILRKKTNSKAQFYPSVSVIVPYRNERENIPDLILNLSKQDYPSKLLEYIFIDDHSSDNGFDIAVENSTILQCKVLNLQNPTDIAGKKATLRRASHYCTGDIILLTDADCQFEPEWISSMVSSFSNPGIEMVQGPVLIHPAQSLAGNLQQIEFMSLMMSAAGSAGIHHPILASGANLAVRHSSYLEGSKELKDHINTGDDMFLLEFLKRKNKKSISYQASQSAIARTTAVNTFTQLWNQRKRWTSKSTNYHDAEIFGVAILVLLLNLTMVSSLITGIFNHDWILLTAVLWGTKTLIELPLMISGCRFYSISNKLVWFFLTQLIYPFYVVFIVAAGVFGSFSWKNRKKESL